MSGLAQGASDGVLRDEGRTMITFHPAMQGALVARQRSGDEPITDEEMARIKFELSAAFERCLNL